MFFIYIIKYLCKNIYEDFISVLSAFFYFS